MKIYVIGATNRPQELDPAAMRRFVYFLENFKIFFLLFKDKKNLYWHANIGSNSAFDFT